MSKVGVIPILKHRGGHGPHGMCTYTYTPNDSGGSNTLGNYTNQHLNSPTYVIPMDIYIIPIHNVNHNPASQSHLKVFGR